MGVIHSCLVPVIRRWQRALKSRMIWLPPLLNQCKDDLVTPIVSLMVKPLYPLDTIVSSKWLFWIDNSWKSRRFKMAYDLFRQDDDQKYWECRNLNTNKTGLIPCPAFEERRRQQIGQPPPEKTKSSCRCTQLWTSQSWQIGTNGTIEDLLQRVWNICYSYAVSQHFRWNLVAVKPIRESWALTNLRRLILWVSDTHCPSAEASFISFCRFSFWKHRPILILILLFSLNLALSLSAAFGVPILYHILLL